MKIHSKNPNCVEVSASDVRKFNSEWPCADIPERACWFIFERGHGLVDLSPHLCGDRFAGDSGALSALIDDARKHLSTT